MVHNSVIPLVREVQASAGRLEQNRQTFYSGTFFNMLIKPAAQRSCWVTEEILDSLHEEWLDQSSISDGGRADPPLFHAT
jgi:hypothetical protein